MKKSTTAQRLRQIMNSRNLRQVDILTAAEPYCEKYGIKLGKNALSQYVSGKVEPKQDKLTILGLALGVSEAWLMGFDVPSQRDIAAVTAAIESGALVAPPIRRDDIPENETKSKEESELLRIFNSLDIKGRTQLLAFAYELETKQRSE